MANVKCWTNDVIINEIKNILSKYGLNDSVISDNVLNFYIGEHSWCFMINDDKITINDNNNYMSNSKEIELADPNCFIHLEFVVVSIVTKILVSAIKKLSCVSVALPL